MKPQWTGAVLTVLVVAQLVVPAGRIAKFERTLRTGNLYRFHCAPVDPFDAFRGRFVAVDPQIGAVAWTNTAPPFHSQTVFVKFRHGADGFAEALEAVAEPPSEGDYVAARYRWSPSNGWINVELPFDRFYMPEKLAPRAEQIYRAQATVTNAWLAVRIKNGAGVIENLYVHDRPIAEVVREMANTR